MSFVVQCWKSIKIPKLDASPCKIREGISGCNQMILAIY